MSIYGDVLNLQQQQQSIQDAQTMNQMRMMQLAQMGQAYNIAQTTRQTVRDTELARQQALAGQPPDPNAPPPAGGTPIDNTAPASGNQPAATAPTGIDANPELQGIQSMYKDAASKYQFYTTMAANIRKNGGDIRTAEQYDNNAREQQLVMSQSQARLVQQRKETLGEIGSAAGSATADTFPMVKQRLDALAPGWDRGQDVDFSPLAGGQAVWGPRTQKVLSAMAQSAMTRKQQLDVVHQQMQEQTAQQRADDYEKYVAGRNDAAQANVAARRAGIDERQQEFAYRQQKDAEKAAAPPKPPKEPTFQDVKDMGDTLGSDPDFSSLNIPQRRNVARDFIRYRDTLMAKNIPQDQAEAEARAFVKGRIVPGTEAKPGFMGFGGTPATPPRYNALGAGAPVNAKTPALVPNAAAGALPMPKTAADAVDGKLYQTARGPAIWNAKTQQFTLAK
ncbi:MAG: hypothetical protein KGI71_06515 [Patescibacteria group bacterium]|nr:hypothetical protein [Patescibacteria group bacterium]